MVDAQLSPEIAKYSAILSKDPNSMVFAPLAEAYRKAGMLDEAIATAKDGLARHPNYLSAMMPLGRAYYEKGMLKEAGEALGQVVAMAPDNIIIAKNILEEIKKQWSVASGQGSEKLEPEEEPEALEVEEITEVEEVEAGPVFGEEISEELWTGEAIPEKKAEPKKGITTETIAGLYIKQGYLDKAIDIYQTLYDADPYNEEIKGRLEELKKQISPVPSLLKVGEEGLSGQGPESGGQWSVVSGQKSLESEKPETEEDESVKRLEAWLKSIQNERRKG